MIRAVVLDIGSVLEVIDESLFPGPFEARQGLPPGGFRARLRDDPPPGDPDIGGITEAEMLAHWQRTFSLDDAELALLTDEFWRWYVGTVDQRLYDWLGALRPRLRTALLSNSCVGAREHESRWGFEAVTDDIVYSDEVGLLKPDPAIYRLTQDRLGVQPEEIVFLDDRPDNVEAAARVGWHAILHTGTAQGIAAVEEVIATEGPAGAG
jgi:HAD superfamily hydrolase (TIGR01509 family)